MDYKKIIFRNILGAFVFFVSLVVFGIIGLKTYAVLSQVTSGTPLTASNWNAMISNIFWGSGSGGIYYNGKVGIGTSSPNKSLHIKTSVGTNAELDLQSGDLPHWAIYQDESTKGLAIRNGVIRTSISTGGNLNVQGLCINGDCKTAWDQVGGGGILNYTGTCDNSHKGAGGIMSGVYKICNGVEWKVIAPISSSLVGNGSLVDPYRLLGETSTATTSIATSCNYYNLNVNVLTDGTIRGTGACGNGKQCLTSAIYLIDPDGEGGVDAMKLYCNMTENTGGRTFVSRIVADKLHFGGGNIGTFSSYNQATSWKISDTLINLIPKTVGYRLNCGGTSFTFGSSCIFSAGSSNGNTTCHPGGAGYYGLNNYPNSPQVIYGHSTANGCHNGAWSNTGRLWVK